MLVKGVVEVLVDDVRRASVLDDTPWQTPLTLQAPPKDWGSRNLAWSGCKFGPGHVHSRGGKCNVGCETIAQSLIWRRLEDAEGFTSLGRLLEAKGLSISTSLLE